MGTFTMKLLILVVATLFFVENVSGSIELPLKKHVSTPEQRIKRIKQFETLNNGSSKPQKYLSIYYPEDYFTVSLSIGTPHQPFDLSFDMVFRDVWVLDHGYPNLIPVTHDHNYYYEDDSSTSMSISGAYKPFIYGYDTLGWEFVDIVNFEKWGDISLKFGSVYSTWWGWAYPDGVEYDFPTDGVIGFGTSTIYDSDLDPPIVKLLSKEAKKIYTVYIEGHVPPSRGTINGSLTLGDYDQKNCGAFNNKPVPQVANKHNEHNWVFIVSEIQFGRYAHKIDRNAFVNIAVPSIQLPEREFTAFMKQITYSYDSDINQYKAFCDQPAPDIQFTIDGKVYVVSKQHYLIDMDLGANICVVAVEKNEYENVYGLGVPFIETYCVATNITDHSLNFAPVLKK